MAAQTAAASLSGYVDFAKWGMDGFTDSDEDDFLCTCGKVITYTHPCPPEVILAAQQVCRIGFNIPND